MGNCVFSGRRPEANKVVRVMTANGGIMELRPPMIAECLTNEFPGHGLFHSSKLLLHNEELLAGKLYHLLPLSGPRPQGFETVSGEVTYRMSTLNHFCAWRRPAVDGETEMRSERGGVWKVKLVISPEQLSEILSQEARTEALVESVRTVAKCGNGQSSTAASSDQWSLGSGCNT